MAFHQLNRFIPGKISRARQQLFQQFVFLGH